MTLLADPPRPGSLALALVAMLAACAPQEVGGDHDLEPLRRARALADAGADPKLNADFRSEALDVAAFVERFEGESREIALARDAIVAALELAPGTSLADVGAGTGLFLGPFDGAVGQRGQVFAIDISPAFVAHMERRIAGEGLARTRTVLCDDIGIGLPPASVDVVFVCDTYHHFEQVAEVLASIHAALRPGGRLFIVDFERLPGTSREWILEHVRCDKQTVIDEVTTGGFRLDAELDVPGLTENYLLRFVRRP